ncbi:MAG: toll/interleukin-1 receptor domain-containing protein [candidate division Zixibacteria bacterium]|nr:toll/interleukin-1 receptor domain-containing protein [candidate division Zixibacteria bacterium]
MGRSAPEQSTSTELVAVACDQAVNITTFQLCLGLVENICWRRSLVIDTEIIECDTWSMVDSQMDNPVPKVFVSYSHDSPEHKQWVAELSSRLRHDGINVILDQWDLSPGEDITMFIENGLAQSDRVLIICTEQYVRKADAGKGGVGYERMIVTVELVQDCGTQKFIPVVRQKGKKSVLPKFMGSRFFVNLSSDEEYAREYDLLLRELHKQPAERKPALGKSPFATQPSGEELPKVEARFIPLSEAVAHDKDIAAVYATALQIARSGDLVSWRKLVKDIRSRLPGSLQQWREERGLDQIREKKDLPAIVDEAVAMYAPLFVTALAGVQSGREKFSDQRAVIDEIANPSDWKISGTTAIVDIPSTLVFVFQALHGATCLDIDQLDQAVRLGLTRVPTWHKPDADLLIWNVHLTGWPDSLGGDCTVAWDYLTKAPERWSWLTDVFGLVEDYRVSLASYYMALHVLELATAIATGKIDTISGKIRFTVPICYLNEPDGIPQKAYRLLLRSDPKQIWQGLDVTLDDMKKHWPLWLKDTGAWLTGVYKSWHRFPIVHKDLLDEV